MGEYAYDAMKEPVELLLKVLINGHRVEHNGYIYGMSEDGCLCLVTQPGTDNELGLRIDCDISDFKKMSDDIGRDELWLKCCEIELHKENMNID